MRFSLFIIVLLFVTPPPLLAGKGSSSILSLDPDDPNEFPVPQSPSLQKAPTLKCKELPNFGKERMEESAFSVAVSRLSLYDLESAHMNLARALANYVQDSLQFTDDKTLTKEINLLETLPIEERTESLLLINTKREALSKLKTPPSRLLEFLCLVSRKERTLDFVVGVMSLFEAPLKQEVLNELHILSQSSGKASTLLNAQNFFQPGCTMAKNMMNLITVCNRLPSDDKFLSKLKGFRSVQRPLILGAMASSKEKLSPNIPLELLIVLKKFDPKDRTEETIQNLLSVLNHKVDAQKKPLTSAMLLICLNKYKKDKWPRILNHLVAQIQRL